MPARTGHPAAWAARSAFGCRAAAIGLLLAGLAAAAPGATAGSATVKSQARSGYSRYQEAMNHFLAGEWQAARERIEQVLLEFADSMEHGDPVHVGRKKELYLPHYYLGLCLCELGERQAAMASLREVLDWYVDYPAIQPYVDNCVIPYCGKGRENLPKGCHRPRSVESEASGAGSVSDRSPTAGAPLASSAALGAAPW